MDSKGDKSVEAYTEQFRTLFPHVSIQSLSDKGTNKVTQSVEKRSPARTPQKTTVAGQKATVGVSVKTPVLTKTVVNTPKTIINLKQATTLTPKTITPVQAKLAVGAKQQAVTKTPVAPKTPTQVASKTPTQVAPKAPSQVIAKANVVTTATSLKTVPIHQVVKTPSTAVKTPVAKTPVVKTSVAAPMVKASPQKVTTVKAAPNTVKVPVTKEVAPDQSTTTVVYHMQQPTQRTSNQLTIEKIEQQQRVPVVLDSNQVVVRSGQALVLQNPQQLQSVVIGTSTLPASAVVAPQVEITTSEPLQALQVTQQVTLYGPKGKPFAVDDVKKQINLNKQSLSSTMTNVVSSTTNPIPVPTQSVQPEQKKNVVPVRLQEGVSSPVRLSNRVSAMVRAQQKVTQPAAVAQSAPQPVAAPAQYASTLGQIKKVSPKREIPMQKVSPLPPSLPPPDMELANEEEVTTSEEVPVQQSALGGSVQLIVILPNGEKKEISVPDSTLNCTVNDLINQMGESAQPDMMASVLTVTDQETLQASDSSGAPWTGGENAGTEPGEILGLQDEMETSGDGNGENSEQNIEEDNTQKEIASRSEPLYREGLLAVCSFCGYSSIDFNQCQRCNRKIPQNCKTVSADFTQGAVSKGRKTKADGLTGGSPKKKRVCRKKKVEEPVCLTISDDEELLGLSHHHQISEESLLSDSNSQMSSCDKEPVITDEMVSELKQSISGDGADIDALLDNTTPDLKTTLQCRTVRIGSYKVVPKDKVLITSNGIKVKVPMVGSSQIVDLVILHHEIIKVLIHFGRACPVLFLYTRPAAAARVRKTLQMTRTTTTDKNNYYYDCMSSDETHRRITFLPDKIDDDCNRTLREIYKVPENLFAELTGKEANDILVKASPKEVVQAFLNKKQPAPVQPPQPFNGQNIQTIMVYPPPPEKGGIPINTEDYACLDCDQFLNDVIIDFYLKYVVEKTLSPEDRARTHVFSSFFYKRLTTKPPPKRKSMNPVENDPTASPAVKRHSRVKSWTKNVNLFTKDFIIIPINENSHWFLAIVCFPGLTGPVRFSDNTPIELPGRKKKKLEDKTSLSGKHMVTIGSTTITAVTPAQAGAALELGDDVEDRDEADGEDEHMDVPDEDEDAQKTVPEVKEELEEEEEPKPKKKEREPIKQPCILIFDSLAGASRSRVVATLRDYLRVEYEAKHGEARDFSGDVLKGTNVRCPQQTNYTDCGLYVLQYVEAFFKWPITDFHIPIMQVQDWFQADIVTRKRYDIQQLLLHLMEEQRIDIEALNLPVLNLSADMGMRYVGSEEEDDEDDQMGEEEEDEDEMLGEDGEYNDEMDHETTDMEEGEIGIVHHEEDYLDPAMEHEEHELDEEDYEEQLDEEVEDEEELEDPGLEELEDEKMGMGDVSLTPIGSAERKDLKKFRIPRLAEKDKVSENAFKEA